MKTKSSFGGKDIREILYTEEFRFNMAALYMSIIADIIKSTVVSALNSSPQQFLTATREFLEISAPIIMRKSGDVKALRQELDSVEDELIQLSKISTPMLKTKKEKDLIKKIRMVRATILEHMSPFLMPTETKLTPDAKLKEALGL